MGDAFARLAAEGSPWIIGLFVIWFVQRGDKNQRHLFLDVVKERDDARTDRDAWRQRALDCERRERNQEAPS